ncbi:MAG: hypothetical protein ACNA7Q_12330, partial [Rhodobacterales bacterium]
GILRNLAVALMDRQSPLMRDLMRADGPAGLTWLALHPYRNRRAKCNSANSEEGRIMRSWICGKKISSDIGRI